ncbi:MAG: shikimate kinase [Clostridia bacterium]|nr:shikimate kinase [Clostridia bacterium]
MKKNIVLCGFMGSGKSTVGKLLAEKMGRKLIDTDAYIVKKENMPISQIFAEKGEEYFRACETQVCKELSQLSGCIISTGGGTLLREENVTEMKKNGIVFLLDVNADTVLARLKFDNTRPLLQREDKETAVRSLMEQRIPLYCRAADHVINAAVPPWQICNKIMDIYNNSVS